MAKEQNSVVAFGLALLLICVAQSINFILINATLRVAISLSLSLQLDDAAKTGLDDVWKLQKIPQN